jgi:hypothetical protein
VSDILIDVWADFTASHRCAEGVEHPHGWRITGTFKVPAYTDARVYRASIDELAKLWNDTTLPAHLDWSEDILRAVLTLNNCVDAKVSRPAERIAVRPA